VLAPGEDDVVPPVYYFVHSFGCEPAEAGLSLGRAAHGVPFCAAAGRGPVMGVQFHPEKSSRAGLALLGRWLASVEGRSRAAEDAA
jgi:glutamine amidotransferase